MNNAPKKRDLNAWYVGALQMLMGIPSSTSRVSGAKGQIVNRIKDNMRMTKCASIGNGDNIANFLLGRALL